MIIEKEKRSVKMSRADHKALKAWVHSQQTNQHAADALGISRTSLDRICVLGSGKPSSIAKIKEVISACSN